MRESLEASGSVYLTEFEGLTVAQSTDLRGQLIDAGGRMQVVKNRLMMIAVEGTPYENLADLFVGPNAVTYCGDDPIAPLKVLAEFANDHKQPPVKAGVVEGERLSPQELDTLSKVPGRDELIAAVVGGFGGPVNDLVFTLGGVVSELVFTLQAIAEKQDGAEAAA